MSTISNNTIQRIEKWLYHGTSLESAFPRLDQQYRVKLCYEFYQRWLQNKDIQPRIVCRNIARRDYSMFLRKAGEGDEHSQQMIQALHITINENGEVKPRTEVEISNDVQLCNAIIRYFQEKDDAFYRHKAQVLDNSEWLMREGKKRGDIRAVGKGIDVMIGIYDGFKQKDDAASEMPNANINISDDPTIVRRDRRKYSDEDMRAAYKEFGLTEKKVETLVEQSDGSWALPSEDPDGDDPREEDVILQRDKTHEI